MADYATVQDVIELFKPLTAEERARAEALIPLVCDALRVEASKVGKNLDAMVEEDLAMASNAKSVTVGVVSRIMRQDVEGEPVAQESQSALGYSVSATYAIPGGGIVNSIMKSDLKALGLRRQKYGVLEL